MTTAAPGDQTLEQALLDGSVELRSAAFAAAQPVDLAATGPGGSIVMLAGWWLTDWNGDVEAVVRYARPLERRGRAAWGPEGFDGELLGPESDGDMAARLADNRLRADYDRPEYLRQLSLLRDAFAGIVDLDPWTAAFAARPARDAAADLREARAGRRRIGRVFLYDADGRAVDCLAADDRGQAATAAGTPWMASAAAAFAARTPGGAAAAVDLADYLNWLAAQQPYGGGSVGGAGTFDGDGYVADVAARLLAERAAGAAPA